ncbi:MAG TPA: pyridoxamine 5'-phosphate oxidase family protein [Bacteroidales bacterium]|nr:pyridoxamine 5'-phosphate oxidase family protein [Bacteroidales bacterium]
MNPIDKRILKLIRKHHIFTLATAEDNKPYCSTCFYTYIEQKNVFVFISEHKTRHIGQVMKQPVVAGSIALETRIIGKIRGLQFTGKMTELKDQDLQAARKAYLLKFPYTLPFLKDTPFWGITPDFIKLTDNRMGFGTKLIWSVLDRL